MNIRIHTKQAARICFLMFMVCGFIILSTTSYAASIPSYDLVKQFPGDPRDYQQVVGPSDVAFDSAGNVYVGDAGQNMIIKYNAAGDYVTHWTVYGIRRLTLDPTSGHIYVGRTNDEIEIYDDSGNHLHTFGGRGSGDGEFTGIFAIAIDDDYIYIADSGNNRVQIFRKSDHSFVTSVGGSGTGDGELQYPTGLTVGSGHQLYVADSNNARVQLFTWNSGTSTWTYHSKLSILSPRSLHLQEASDGNHTLYVLDLSGAGIKLQEVIVTGHDLNTVDPATIVTTDIDVRVFTKHINTAMTWHPIENELYAVNHRNIARLDDVSDWTNWLGMSTDQFQTAGGLAIDSSGYIYIADTYQHRILKYAPDGSFQHSFGQAGSGDGEFLQPKGIAVDSAGNIYVADTLNYRVQKFKPDGTFDKKWGVQGEGDGKFRQMNDLIVDAHDYVYVADFKTVQKFDADGSHIMTFGDRLCGTTGHPPCSDPGKVQTASGVGIDSAGYVYISDGTEHYLNKFRADGSFEERWGGAGTAVGNFNGPRKIAIDAADQIHVVDAYNYRIQIVQTDGTFLGEFGGYPVTSSIIDDLAFSHAGQFYVLDGNHLKVFQPRASGPLSDLAAIGEERSVTLTFSAANGATTITVKQREAGTATWIDATTLYTVTASSTEATVIGLTDDTEYEFKLEVIGGPHAGDSNIATARTLEAARPINDLTAIGGDREITLTFSPLTAATSVKVKIWDPVAAVWVDATTAAPIAAGATSATVIGLADDTYYYLYIEVQGGPRRGNSNAAGASTNPPPVVTTPISDLTAIGGDRSVTLNFSPPTGATSVTVKQRVSGETAWTDATTASPITDSSTSAVVTGLLDDTTYEFYLSVVGGSYAGDSNIASARTNVAVVVDTIPPEWPATSELVVSDITQSTVKLSWPQALDNVAVEGYRIFVDGHQEVDRTVTDFTYSVTDSVYSYILTGLTPSTTYHFTVKAYDASDNVSEPGLSVSATTEAPASSGGGTRSMRSSDSSPPSNNADLKRLEIRTEQGIVPLTPAFQPGITEYTLETTTERIELVLGADKRRVSIIWQGQTLSGESVSIDLQPGKNEIQLVVQAEDRSTKTYTLTINYQSPELSEQKPPFHDTEGHWAEHQIAEALAKGLVTGYQDGTFKPDQPVTRAEFIVLLIRSLQLDGEGGELTFTDAAQIDAWAADAIRLAVQEGIIEGYHDGTIRPDQPITRVEAAVIIARALQLVWEADQESGFADNDAIPQWGRGAVEAIREQGIINGRGDHEFVPFASTTRAEAIVMLLRIME